MCEEKSRMWTIEDERGVAAIMMGTIYTDGEGYV